GPGISGEFRAGFLGGISGFPEPSPPSFSRLSPPGWVRQRLEEIWGGVRPWGSFLDQRRFGVPRDFGELCRRLGHNAERFQSNYLILFLGLVLYCLLTSQLLLVALGVFVGAAVAVRLRAREAPLVILGETGREL
uniref:PRA1 family protein n=1 Tax=Cyanistes caeruleus TaxID=156563 RepID=A0A8C0U5I3_CYACU